MAKIKIEIQYILDCPNSPILIKRVKDLIKEYHNIEYREILIDSNLKAREYKFRGSPTLLINGGDFENLPAPINPNLACRWYPNGLPEVKDIREKLKSL